MEEQSTKTLEDVEVYSSHFSVIGEIEAVMRTITEPAIRRAGEKMPAFNEVTEKAIGTVHSDACRRLFMAVLWYTSMSGEAAARAGRAQDDIEEKAQLDDAERLKELSDFSRHLLWTQIRSECHQHGGDIALRANWMAVDPGPQPGGGGIRGFLASITGQ